MRPPDVFYTREGIKFILGPFSRVWEHILKGAAFDGLVSLPTPGAEKPLFEKRRFEHRKEA